MITAACKEAGDGAGKAWSHRRTMAQRRYEDGKRTNADQRNGDQADNAVRADQSGRPCVGRQNKQFDKD
jgi:hypothetical protein